MTPARNFLLAIPLGFLAALGLYMGAVFAQLGAPTALSYWCHEITLKKRAAAAEADSPKLVLLGGSATLFGVNAAELERTLGVPTINGATHAALGMAYILESGKRLLRTRRHGAAGAGVRGARIW